MAPPKSSASPFRQQLSALPPPPQRWPECLSPGHGHWAGLARTGLGLPQLPAWCERLKRSQRPLADPGGPAAACRPSPEGAAPRSRQKAPGLRAVAMDGRTAQLETSPRGRGRLLLSPGSELCAGQTLPLAARPSRRPGDGQDPLASPGRQGRWAARGPSAGRQGQMRVAGSQLSRGCLRSQAAAGGGGGTVQLPASHSRHGQPWGSGGRWPQARPRRCPVQGAAAFPLRARSRWGL